MDMTYTQSNQLRTTLLQRQLDGHEHLQSNLIQEVQAELISGSRPPRHATVPWDRSMANE